MMSLIGAVSGWFFGSVASGAESPSALVAYQAAPISLASDSLTDQDGPAIIRHIHLDGNKEFAHPESTIHLSYDNTNLYVVAELKESENGYPKAQLRPPTGDLTMDDAFQVVLGMADPADVNREILNMGGYKGALNAEITAADFYYQFTVNSVGSQSRTYNETPLKRPLFESAVHKTADGWLVRMNIPFSSIGLANPEGKTIFANFFRFRPPLTTAWYYPGFGGYSGMPFGTLQFLPKGHEQKATVESEVPPLAPPSPPAVSPIITPAEARDQIGINLQYYPLSGAIVAHIVHPANAHWTKTHGVFTVDGKASDPQSLTDGPETYLTLGIPPGSQPQHDVHFQVEDEDDTVLSECQQTFHELTAPIWFGTQAGMDYVDSKIPAPWKSPVIDQDSVTLAHCQIRFGSFGLISSIRDDLGELMAGDSTIVVEQDKQPLMFQMTEKTVKKEGSWTVAKATNVAGPYRLEAQSSMDYDGFTEVKLRLTGADLTSINRLTVRIPLDSKQARFTEKVLVQDVKNISGFDFEAAEGPLWVGDEDKGIRFSYDSDPFLSKSSRDRVRVVRSNGVAWLEFDLVNQPGQLADKGHIFRFFLQPTPTKPRSMVQGYSQVRLKWEQWADHEGEIDLSKTGMLRDWTDDLAKQNLIGLVYTNQGLASDMPEMMNFPSDLLLQPPWMFDKRNYNPGLGVPCYATDKRGPDGQRILYGLNKLIEEAHIGGICDDGLGPLMEDENPVLPGGNGFPPDVEWGSVTNSPLIGQRNFLKKLRGIFDETGKPFDFTGHTGGGIDIATLSFFDRHMEGEQLTRYRPGYHIPLSTFAIGYNGQPWGFRGVFWDKTWRRSAGYYWSYIYAYLFDTDYEDTEDVYQLLKDFQDTKTNTFYPYWRLGPHVKVKADHSLVSYFRNAKDALVTVGNMEYGDDPIQLDLSGLFPGKRVIVTNVLAGNAVVPLDKDGVLKEIIPGWHGSVFRVKPVEEEEIPATSEEKETQIKTDDWNLIGGLRGVILKWNHDAEGQPTTAFVSSTIYQDEAQLGFTPVNKWSPSEGRLLVQHSGRLRLRFGDAAIFYDSGAWQSNGVTGGKLFQPSPVVGSPALIEFSIDHGILDVSYNGEPLARGLQITGAPKVDFSVSTWADDTLTVKPVEMSTMPLTLYEPKEGVNQLIKSPSSAPFDIDSFQKGDWAVAPKGASLASDTRVGDKDGLEINSTSGVGNEAALTTQHFGLNGTISLWIQHAGRIRIQVGNEGVFWDGSWQIFGNVAGWSEGRLFQPPPVFNTPVLVSIYMKDGLWTVMYGNRVVLRNGSFAEQQKGGNILKISTWAGDSVCFSVRKLSSTPSDPPTPNIGQPVL